MTLQDWVRIAYALLLGLALGMGLVWGLYGRQLRKAQAELRDWAKRVEGLGAKVLAYKGKLDNLASLVTAHYQAGEQQRIALTVRLNAARKEAVEATGEAETHRVKADQLAGLLARSTQDLVIARGGQAGAEQDRTAKAERIAELEGWLEALGVNPLTGPMPIEGGPSNG